VTLFAQALPGHGACALKPGALLGLADPGRAKRATP